MKVRLDQVRYEPFVWQETYEFPAATLQRPELLDLSPVAWRGQVVFAEPDFLLKGRMEYQQTLVCDRCLKEFRQPVKGDVELMVHVAGREDRREEKRGGGEHELEERDLGVITIRGEVLDTDPILAEQVQLNLPMKPLCREDCAGLCPTCGADRNGGPCACVEPAGDARWGALADLKRRLQMDDEAKT
jgi:uncharacterized protein